MRLRDRIQLKRQIEKDLTELIKADPTATDQERAEILADRYGLDIATILEFFKTIMPLILMLIELFKPKPTPAN